MDGKQALVPQAVLPAHDVTKIENSNINGNNPNASFYLHQEPALSPIRTGILPPRTRMDSVDSLKSSGFYASGLDNMFMNDEDECDFFAGTATTGNQHNNDNPNGSVLYKNGTKTKYSHPGERTSEILSPGPIGYHNFSTGIATPRRHPGRAKSPSEPDYVSPMSFVHDNIVYHRFQPLPPTAAVQSEQQQRKSATATVAAAASAGATGTGSVTTGAAKSTVVLIPSLGNNVAGPMWTAVDLAHRPPLQEGATPLVRRFLETLKDFDEHAARRVLKAYRQFLTLVAKHQDWMYTLFLVPSIVREMWLIHASNVPMYCHDCMLLCGHVVGGSHIVPAKDLTRKECKRRRDFTLEQLQLLNKNDGDDVDEKFWVFDDIFEGFEGDDDDEDDDDDNNNGKAKDEQEKDVSPTDATTITTATQEPPNESLKAGHSEEHKEIDLSQDSKNNNEKHDDDDADSEHSSCDSVSDPINVSVSLHGDESAKTWFKIRPKTAMGKLFENIPYNKYGVRDPDSVQHVLAQRRHDGGSSDDDEYILIDPEQEAMALGLQNNDQIYLVLKETDSNHRHVNDTQHDEDEIYKPVASIAETEAEEPTASSLYIHDDGNHINISNDDNMTGEDSDDEVHDESPPVMAEQNKRPIDNENEKSLPRASEDNTGSMDEDETSLPDEPRENAVPMRTGGKALHARSGSGTNERSRSAIKKAWIRNARKLPVRKSLALKPPQKDDDDDDDDDSPSPSPTPAAGEAGLGAIVSPDAVDRQEEVADADAAAKEEVGKDMDEKEEEAVVVTGSDDGNHDTDPNDHGDADVGLKENVVETGNDDGNHDTDPNDGGHADVGLKEEKKEIIVLDGADESEDNNSEAPPERAPAANRRRTRSERDFEEIALQFPPRVAKKQKKATANTITTNTKAATTTKKKESNIENGTKNSDAKSSANNSLDKSEGGSKGKNSKDDSTNGKKNSKDKSKGSRKGKNSMDDSKGDKKGNRQGNHSKNKSNGKERKAETLSGEELRRRALKKELEKLDTYLFDSPDLNDEKQITTRNGRSETKSSKKRESPDNGRSETKPSKKKEPPTRAAKPTATNRGSQSRSKSPKRRVSLMPAPIPFSPQKKNPSRKSRGDQAWQYKPS